jgi:energy-coupling factor transporter ATP-binding protein EcfA2
MSDNYVIGYFIRQKIIDFIKLLWSGSVTASREDSRIAIMYGVLGVVMLLFGLISGRWSIVVFVILAVATALGIWRYMKDAPLRRRRNAFHGIFRTMGFYAKGDIYPFFMCETEVSEYTTVLSFDTLIPASSWIARKEELQMYLDIKIIDIRTSTGDNRVVNVYTQSRQLPNYLEWKDEYINNYNILNIGVSYNGTVGMNLNMHPHAFIAGETGSGKSNILKCFIYQVLAKKYSVVLIDFKRGVSFAEFGDKITIHYEYPEVVQVLKDMVTETHSRLDRFREVGVDNINDNNHNTISHRNISRKIVFIDELAELLKTRDKAISNALSDSIETLTRLSRAVGIHLIMGIQRPDSTIVSGQIKNNVSFRVCGRFVDPEPSRIMLGNERASRLPNIKGRFIVKDDNMYEVQAFYFSKPKTTPTHNIAVQEQEEQPTVITSPTLAPVVPHKLDEAQDGETDGNVEAKPPHTKAQAEAVSPPMTADTIGNIAEEVPTKPKEPEAPRKAEDKPQSPDPIDFDFSSFKK